MRVQDPKLGNTTLFGVKLETFIDPLHKIATLRKELPWETLTEIGDKAYTNEDFGNEKNSTKSNGMNLKKVFLGNTKSQAKIDSGDKQGLMLGCIGYNLRYAF